jgi:hypothetical protein
MVIQIALSKFELLLTLYLFYTCIRYRIRIQRNPGHKHCFVLVRYGGREAGSKSVFIISGSMFRNRVKHWWYAEPEVPKPVS